MINIKGIFLTFLKCIFLIFYILECYVREKNIYNFYLYIFDLVCGLFGIIGLFYDRIFDFCMFPFFSFLFCVIFTLKESNDISKLDSQFNLMFIKNFFKLISFDFKDFNEFKQLSILFYSFYKLTFLNLVKFLTTFIYYLFRIFFNFYRKSEKKKEKIN